VTVRVTTPKGADAGAYYVEQLPSYYLQAGEPRGIWLGRAAGEFDRAGEVSDDDFLALMAGLDPRSPERLEVVWTHEHRGSAPVAREEDTTWCCSMPSTISDSRFLISARGSTASDMTRVIATPRPFDKRPGLT
jgi:hypothetical protein